MLVIAWIDHLMGTFRCWDQIQYFYLKIFKNSVIFSHFFKIWLNFWKFLKSNTKYLKWPPSRYFWVLMLNLMLLFENLRKISHFSRGFFKQNLAKFWILSCHWNDQLVICVWWYMARTLIKVNMVMCDGSNFTRSDVSMISHLIVVRVLIGFFFAKMAEFKKIKIKGA